MAAIVSGTYTSHLTKDRKLAPLVKSITLPPLKKRKNICLRLCASIISQQLSTRVAEVIYRRFLELYDGAEPTPQQIIDTPFDKLRSIGLSNAKVGYVQNVARFIIEHKMDDRKLYRMTNDEVIDTLTRIKGVGRWTVEMLLMFSLGRPDVFAIDDLIIRQSIIRLYKLEVEDKKALNEQLLKISSKWSPFRTYACMYLWRYKDTIEK